MSLPWVFAYPSNRVTWPITTKQTECLLNLIMHPQQYFIGICSQITTRATERQVPRPSLNVNISKYPLLFPPWRHPRKNRRFSRGCKGQVWVTRQTQGSRDSSKSSTKYYFSSIGGINEKSFG